MSRLNLEQLKTFLAVVRTGGVRKAAAALNLTQPAVTARIRNLESSLGCELFERDGNRMHLTKRGELLLTHAAQFERLADRVEQDIVDPAGVDNHLRIGVSETIAQCWLPELIARLHARYPRLNIEFNVDISLHLRAALLSREIDLAILLGPVSEYSVDNIELPGFDLAWYVAADAPFPDDPQRYLDGPVMSYARNTRPYRELKALLQEHVGPDVPLFPSTSLSACFRLVEAGLGVAALPRALGRAYVSAGSLREFDPGWMPEPLRFSASFLGDDSKHLAQTAAETALAVATDFLSDRNALSK